MPQKLDVLILHDNIENLPEDWESHFLVREWAKELTKLSGDFLPHDVTSLSEKSSIQGFFSSIKEVKEEKEKVALTQSNVFEFHLIIAVVYGDRQGNVDWHTLSPQQREHMFENVHAQLLHQTKDFITLLDSFSETKHYKAVHTHFLPLPPHGAQQPSSSPTLWAPAVTCIQGLWSKAVTSQTKSISVWMHDACVWSMHSPNTLEDVSLWLMTFAREPKLFLSQAEHIYLQLLITTTAEKAVASVRAVLLLQAKLLFSLIEEPKFNVLQKTWSADDWIQQARTSSDVSMETLLQSWKRLVYHPVDQQGNPSEDTIRLALSVEAICFRLLQLLCTLFPKPILGEEGLLQSSEHPLSFIALSPDRLDTMLIPEFTVRAALQDYELAACQPDMHPIHRQWNYSQAKIKAQQEKIKQDEQGITFHPVMKLDRDQRFVYHHLRELLHLHTSDESFLKQNLQPGNVGVWVIPEEFFTDVSRPLTDAEVKQFMKAPLTYFDSVHARDRMAVWKSVLSGQKQRLKGIHSKNALIVPLQNSAEDYCGLSLMHTYQSVSRLLFPPHSALENKLPGVPEIWVWIAVRLLWSVLIDDMAFTKMRQTCYAFLQDQFIPWLCKHSECVVKVPIFFGQADLSSYSSSSAPLASMRSVFQGANQWVPERLVPLCVAMWSTLHSTFLIADTKGERMDSVMGNRFRWVGGTAAIRHLYDIVSYHFRLQTMMYLEDFLDLHAQYQEYVDRPVSLAHTLLLQSPGFRPTKEFARAMWDRRDFLVNRLITLCVRGCPWWMSSSSPGKPFLHSHHIPLPSAPQWLGLKHTSCSIKTSFFGTYMYMMYGFEEASDILATPLYL